MSTQFSGGHALLIAVNQSLEPDYALPDVAKDVEAVHRVLTHPERCGYSDQNIMLLRDDQATRANILNGLSWLQKCVDADASGQATAVIYYTGHGWRTGATGPATYYLLPYDVNRAQFSATALRAEDFAAAIASIRARRLLVILDCCRAGGMGVKGLDALPEGYAQAALPPAVLSAGPPAAAAPAAKGPEPLLKGEGRAVLSSSTGDQLSYLRKNGKMSIFTYHLVEALTGHARPADGDTEVWVSDLISHVSHSVPPSARADWNREQTPYPELRGDFPVAQLLGGQAWSKDILPPTFFELDQPREPRDAATYSNVGGSVINGPLTIGDGSSYVGGPQTTTITTIGTVSGPAAIATGAGAQATVAPAGDALDFDGLLAGLRQAAAQAPPGRRGEASAAAEALQWELEKGSQADDHVMARLVTRLAVLAPAAGDELANLFTNLALSTLAGNATNSALRKIAGP